MDNDLLEDARRRRFCTENGKICSVIRSGGTDRRIVCLCSSMESGCRFYVQAYRNKRCGKWLKQFFISSMEIAHSNCLSVPKPTQSYCFEIDISLLILEKHRFSVGEHHIWYSILTIFCWPCIRNWRATATLET